MRFWSRSLFLVFAATAIVSGSAGAQQAVKLIIAAPPGTSTAPALYAVRSGLFRKYGLEVEIQKMNSGAVIIPAVLGGSVQIGTGNSFSIVTAHSRNVPLQIIAGGAVYQTDEPIPYGMVLVRKDSPIRAAADLNGKTVGLAVARGDLNSTATQAWVEQHGGAWSSVHVLEIPVDAMVAALEQGRIDAFTMQSPNATIAMESGAVRLLGNPYDAVAKRFSIAAWFTSTDWAAKNPEVVRRFVQAMGEASRYTNAHPQEIMPLLAAFSGVEPRVLEHAARAPFVDRIDPQDLQPVIDLEVQYKVIDKGFDAKDLIAPGSQGR